MNERKRKETGKKKKKIVPGLKAWDHFFGT